MGIGIFICGWGEGQRDRDGDQGGWDEVGDGMIEGGDRRGCWGRVGLVRNVPPPLVI